MENKVLNFYRLLIEGCAHEENNSQTLVDGKCKLWCCRDLLNKAIRRWDVPPENYYASEKALALWKNFSCEKSKNNIFGTYEDFPIVAKNDIDLISFYKGSFKNPEKTEPIAKGTHCKFNDIFHIEHIIPVSKLVDRLINTYKENANKISDKEIFSIINEQSVARILKEEDRKLPKTKRPNNLEEILKVTYKDIKLQKQS